MQRIKFIMIALILAISFAGCSKDSEQEATESYTYDKLLGRWLVTSYYTSGGYFVPNSDGEYYEFTSNKQYTHYYGDVLKDVENGTFLFESKTYTVVGKDPRGWDFTINVSFTGENSATFDIKGKTETQSKTVKVVRQ